jgi:hypothetical protein
LLRPRIQSLKEKKRETNQPTVFTKYIYVFLAVVAIYREAPKLYLPSDKPLSCILSCKQDFNSSLSLLQPLFMLCTYQNQFKQKSAVSEIEHIVHVLAESPTDFSIEL